MSVTAGLLLAAAAATPGAAAPPPDPKACAPGSHSRLEQPPTKAPGTADPSVTTGSGASQNPTLSDKLARSDGVLCPPNVDPDIKAPTPGRRQDAGDSAARQPRRRSERAAEIGLPDGVLDIVFRRFLYPARSGARAAERRGSPVIVAG